MLYGNLNNMIVFILKYKFQKYKINSCLSFRTTLQAGLPQYDIEILKPVNMLLFIQRNLAATWYVQIPGMEIKGKLKPMQVSIYIYENCSGQCPGQCSSVVRALDLEAECRGF